MAPPANHPALARDLKVSICFCRTSPPLLPRGGQVAFHCAPKLVHITVARSMQQASQQCHRFGPGGGCLTNGVKLDAHSCRSSPTSSSIPWRGSSPTTSQDALLAPRSKQQISRLKSCLAKTPGAPANVSSGPMPLPSPFASRQEQVITIANAYLMLCQEWPSGRDASGSASGIPHDHSRYGHLFNLWSSATPFRLRDTTSRELPSTNDFVR